MLGFFFFYHGRNCSYVLGIKFFWGGILIFFFGHCSNPECMRTWTNMYVYISQQSVTVRMSVSNIVLNQFSIKENFGFQFLLTIWHNNLVRVFFFWFVIRDILRDDNIDKIPSNIEILPPSYLFQTLLYKEKAIIIVCYCHGIRFVW